MEDLFFYLSFLPFILFIPFEEPAEFNLRSLFPGITSLGDALASIFNWGGSTPAPSWQDLPLGPGGPLFWPEVIPPEGVYGNPTFSVDVIEHLLRSPGPVYWPEVIPPVGGSLPFEPPFEPPLEPAPPPRESAPSTVDVEGVEVVDIPAAEEGPNWVVTVTEQLEQAGLSPSAIAGLGDAADLALLMLQNGLATVGPNGEFVNLGSGYVGPGSPTFSTDVFANPPGEPLVLGTVTDIPLDLPPATPPGVTFSTDVVDNLLGPSGPVFWPVIPPVSGGEFVTNFGTYPPAPSGGGEFVTNFGKYPPVPGPTMFPFFEEPPVGFGGGGGKPSKVKIPDLPQGLASMLNLQTGPSAPDPGFPAPVVGSETPLRSLFDLPVFWLRK